MADASHFYCAMCNRRYRWYEAVAGRTLRCHCGQSIDVPVIEPPAGAIPVAAYQPTSTQDDDSSFYGDFLAIAAHPLRNIVFPAAYFVAALLALTITLHNLFPNAATATGIWIVIVGSSGLVAAGIMLVGLMRASHLEISLVSFAVASFKILAILLLVDASVFVLSNYWVSIGVFTRHMEIGPRLLLTFIAIFVAFIGAMLFGASYPVFNHQDDDFVAVGFPIAIGTWVAHFFVLVLVLVGLSIFRRATYVPPPPPPAVTVQSAPPAAALSSDDEQIFEQIQRHQMIEGRQFEHFRFRNDHGATALVETMYNAGAAKVYFDLRSTFSHGFPDQAYVQLPDDPQRQADCQAAAAKWIAGTQATPLNIPPGKYKKFLIVPLQ